MQATFRSLTAAALAALLVVALAGCGALPRRDVVPEPARHGDFDRTDLGRIAAASLPLRASSGFHLLPDASAALDARLELLARAQLTIDAQYYFIAADGSGRAFLRALQQAAERGVRVRLLVDDLFTAGIEPVLARLSRQPNFEVRLFNPFCCARGALATRFAASLLDAPRLERRMHNKLLVVDRRLAIAGGRNIADDYFGRGRGHAFIDIDALMAGDIVSQLGAVFERYWASEAAWPARQLVAALPAEAAQEDARQARLAAPLLADGRVALVGGTAYAFADSPTKALEDDDDYLQETSVLTRARETILTARSEVVIATPYLIPRSRGMAMIASLHRGGVRLSVLTNGAASNDSLLAHAGYARYRRAMLEQGVELHEIAVDRLRLHAKTFVVDRQTVFIGSTNFDPRSSDKNTELGILVESPALAGQMIGFIEAQRRLAALRVQLGAGAPRPLEWLAQPDGSAAQVLPAEPGIGLLQRLKQLLVVPWVPESLL